MSISPEDFFADVLSWLVFEKAAPQRCNDASLCLTIRKTNPMRFGNACMLKIFGPPC